MELSFKRRSQIDVIPIEETNIPNPFKGNSRPLSDGEMFVFGCPENVLAREQNNLVFMPVGLRWGQIFNQWGQFMAVVREYLSTVGHNEQVRVGEFIFSPIPPGLERLIGSVLIYPGDETGEGNKQRPSLIGVAMQTVKGLIDRIANKLGLGWLSYTPMMLVIYDKNEVELTKNTDRVFIKGVFVGGEPVKKESARHEVRYFYFKPKKEKVELKWCKGKGVCLNGQPVNFEEIMRNFGVYMLVIDSAEEVYVKRLNR